MGREPPLAVGVPAAPPHFAPMYYVAVALGRDETRACRRGCDSGDDSVMPESFLRLPSQPSSSPIRENSSSGGPRPSSWSSARAYSASPTLAVGWESEPRRGLRSQPRTAIAANDSLRAGRSGAWYGTVGGEGRTSDGRDYTAVAPARRAGQNEAWGAAATVVLAIAKGVCLRGGATRRDPERGIAARAAADTKLHDLGAASGGCHGQGEG